MIEGYSISAVTVTVTNALSNRSSVMGCNKKVRSNYAIYFDEGIGSNHDG